MRMFARLVRFKNQAELILAAPRITRRMLYRTINFLAHRVPLIDKNDMVPIN